MQFAFTIGFHILWPTFTIGIACFVAWLSGLWWWTGKLVYRELMRFWIPIFALGFGMGVVTGIVLSYEIGTNWAGYSRSVANVLGPLFMYEALTAFFLEAGFIGIALFGEGRVSKGLATSEAAERVSEGTTHRDISPEFGCEPATQSGCAET